MLARVQDFVPLSNFIEAVLLQKEQSGLLLSLDCEEICPDQWVCGSNSEFELSILRVVDSDLISVVGHHYDSKLADLPPFPV